MNAPAETHVYLPSEDFVSKATIAGMPAYEALCKEAETDYEGYWARLARELLSWKKPFTQVLDESNAPFFKWFADGTLNASYNCLDRNIERGLGDKTALIFEADGGAVTVGPDDTLLTAYNRMRQADVSQLPVLDGGRLIGLIDESDLLDAVEDSKPDKRFAQSVATAMTAKLDTLQAGDPLDALLPVFEKDQVAIVLDGREFVGLITRIDLINYLRRAA